MRNSVLAVLVALTVSALVGCSPSAADRAPATSSESAPSAAGEPVVQEATDAQPEFASLVDQWIADAVESDRNPNEARAREMLGEALERYYGYPVNTGSTNANHRVAAAAWFKIILSQEQYETILAASNPRTGKTLEQMADEDAAEVRPTSSSSKRAWGETRLMERYEFVSDGGKYTSYYLVTGSDWDPSTGEPVGDTWGYSHPYSFVSGKIILSPDAYAYDAGNQSFNYREADRVAWLQ